MKKFLILLYFLSLMLPHPLKACRIIEKRAIFLLKKGTPKQVSIAEKIQKGRSLNDEELFIFNQTKTEALQKMLDEILPIIKNNPLQHGFFEFGYSGSCADSTMAFSDMSEYHLSARASINNTKATYPYRLRDNPAARGTYHPMITWISEDSGVTARFEYKINGLPIHNDTRLAVLNQGGLHWLTETPASEMKRELIRFLPENTVSAFTETKTDIARLLRDMKPNEEGELVYHSDIITKNSLDHNKPNPTPNTYTKIHSTFIYKTSDINAIILDQSSERMISVDLFMDDASITTFLNEMVSKDIESELDDLLTEYERLEGKEKEIYETYLKAYLGKLPEAGEKFHAVKDITWRLMTRYRIHPPK